MPIKCKPIQSSQASVQSLSHVQFCAMHCSRPEPTHTSARDSWTLTGKSESVSCGITAPFSWDLVHTRVFCALQESVSPVLCKFYKFCNQIPLASRVKVSRSFQSLCQIPRLGNLLWVLEIFLTVREFLWNNCSAVRGPSAWWLYCGANSNFIQGAYATGCVTQVAAPRAPASMAGHC